MKKKIMIIVVMLLICTGLYMFAQKAQMAAINKNNKTTASSAKESGEVKKTPETPKEANKVQATSLPAASNQGSTKAARSNTSSGTVIKKDNATTKNSSSPTNNNASNTSQKQEALNPSNNFIIYDAVNKKVIFQTNIDMENKTVDQITCEVLKKEHIAYVNYGEGTSGSYFSSIAGLNEGDSGALSGWCYYVNKNKLGVGAGAYICQKGDVIRWLYLADGSQVNSIDY